MNRIEKIKEKLITFVDSDEGERLRNELGHLTESEYIPKHSPDEIIEFMRRCGSGMSLNRVGFQNQNHPNVWCLFTCASQHVYGDCVREVFDLAIDKAHKAVMEDGE